MGAIDGLPLVFLYYNSQYDKLVKIESVISGITTALIVVTAGALITPAVFAGRVLPMMWVGEVAVGGIDTDDLTGVLDTYGDSLAQRIISLQLRDKTVTRTVAELGVQLNVSATVEAVQQASWENLIQRGGIIPPRLSLDVPMLRTQLEQDFSDRITIPRNATVHLTKAGTLERIESVSGETINLTEVQRRLATIIGGNHWGTTMQLSIVPAQAQIQNDETEQARKFAKQLLDDGFELAFQDQAFTMKPDTVQRMLTFVEQDDTKGQLNRVLGVAFAGEALHHYLATTLAPDIDTEPRDARFEIKDGRVTQFAVPQQGRSLYLQETTTHIAHALARGERHAEAVVEIVEPEISSVDDIEKLGVTTVLAQGESNFAGSPKNRIHNITIGTSRYHGVLIPPGKEFSFLELLGPVDGAHGFLPELVIKENVTTPEFGGGLCQVSTTAFRAAVNSGLKITKRRNHSYAVRYYGIPGFDATIYPPYTDLRFLNDTPGHILIQTRIEDTKLMFEFWGTPDGRKIEIDGPHPYNRQPDGAVKATLTRRVIKSNQEVIEDTFYSNYKSPKLFPKVLAANGEAPTTSPTPTSSPLTQQIAGNKDDRQQSTKPKTTTKPKASPTPPSQEQET